MENKYAEFSIKDVEQWQEMTSSKDFYAQGILRYAAQWANLMEYNIQQGNQTVADCADRTSHDADTEGITGFMYNMAVNALVRVWKYGDELMKWHNQDVAGIEDGDKATAQGELYNSAILVLPDIETAKEVAEEIA